MMPCTASSLKLRIPGENDYQELRENKTRQEYYYNKNAKEMEQLHIGDNVRMWDHKKSIWIPAVVKRICDQLRSYIVQTSEGKYFRRNRKHLRLSVEPEKRFVEMHYEFGEGEEENKVDDQEHEQGDMDRDMQELEQHEQDEIIEIHDNEGDEQEPQIDRRPERKKNLPKKLDYIMYIIT